MQWFGDKNVGVVNASVGTGGDDREIETFDFRIDKAIRNQWMSFTVSAGNSGENVTSPSVGFNAVSVTAIDDANSEYFSDDTWAGYRYLDPYTKNANPDTDYWPHEKPEVAGVGEDVATPYDTGGSSGTSMASPIIAGLVTAMCKVGDDNDTISLGSYPEVVKAMLAAGAVHDDFSTEETIGYGVPTMDFPEPIIANGWFESDLYYESNDKQTYTFDVQSGETVRVAVMFISDAVKGDFSDLRDAQADIDLDLSVEDPSGTTHGSFDYDTTLELVEFDASQDGTCTVDVDKLRWDSNDSNRFFGLAWHRW